MMVFYSGGGTWYYGDNIFFIDLDASGLFNLTETNQREIKYKGKIKTRTLLPVFDHKYGVNPLVNGIDVFNASSYENMVAEFIEATGTEIDYSNFYFVISDYSGVLFTKEDVIHEKEQKLHKSTDTSELSEPEPTASQLDDLSSWQDFKKKAEQAIDRYPEWKGQQTRKIQKSHLDDFIKPITSNTREIKFIKRFLSEKYKL